MTVSQRFLSVLQPSKSFLYKYIYKIQLGWSVKTLISNVFTDQLYCICHCTFVNYIKVEMNEQILLKTEYFSFVLLFTKCPKCFFWSWDLFYLMFYLLDEHR